jgi:hypothetical protein
VERKPRRPRDTPLSAGIIDFLIWENEAMRRFSLGLGAIVLAWGISGCGDMADNPAPPPEQLSPTGGLEAVEKLRNGGTTPTATAKNAKTAAKPAPAAK